MRKCRFLGRCFNNGNYYFSKIGVSPITTNEAQPQLRINGMPIAEREIGVYFSDICNLKFFRINKNQ